MQYLASWGYQAFAVDLPGKTIFIILVCTVIIMFLSFLIDLIDFLDYLSLLLGIGSFTVVDNKIVERSDVGITFFLDTNCIGRNRAECVTQLLQELNEDVKGYYFSEVSMYFIYMLKPCIRNREWLG